jgi:hypothetical protein
MQGALTVQNLHASILGCLDIETIYFYIKYYYYHYYYYYYYLLSAWCNVFTIIFLKPYLQDVFSFAAIWYLQFMILLTLLPR